MCVCLPVGRSKGGGGRGEGGGRGFREDGEGRPDTRAFVELCKTTISSKKRLKKMRQIAKKGAALIQQEIVLSE